MPYVFGVFGPTGTGKTARGLRWIRAQPGARLFVVKSRALADEVSERLLREEPRGGSAIVVMTGREKEQRSLGPDGREAPKRVLTEAEATRILERGAVIAVATAGTAVRMEFSNWSAAAIDEVQNGVSGPSGSPDFSALLLMIRSPTMLLGCPSIEQIDEISRTIGPLNISWLPSLRKRGLRLARDPIKFRDLQPRDCVVVFSFPSLFGVADRIRSTNPDLEVICLTGHLDGAAYRAYRTRADRVVLVGTTFLAEGLNLTIDRLIIAYDEGGHRPSQTDIINICGRACRDEVGGEVYTLEGSDASILEGIDLGSAPTRTDSRLTVCPPFSMAAEVHVPNDESSSISIPESFYETAVRWEEFGLRGLPKGQDTPFLPLFGLGNTMERSPFREAILDLVSMVRNPSTVSAGGLEEIADDLIERVDARDRTYTAARDRAALLRDLICFRELIECASQVGAVSDRALGERTDAAIARLLAIPR